MKEETVPPVSAQAHAYASKGDLINGDIGQHLVRLSVPMMWGIGVVVSFQLVDMLFVSMLGADKLAALSFTFPLTYGIFSLIMGFGIAMSSVSSRLIGAGEQYTVRRVTTHGLIFMALLGIMMALLGIGFLDPLFRLQGAPPEMMPMIRDYMVWWFAGSMFVTVPMVGNAAIRASGDTFTPAMIMTAAALTNFILAPVLIFGLLGFPRLELQGAGIATVIANAVAMFAGLYVLFVRKKLVALEFALNLQQFGNSLKRLMFIALPVGLTNAIQPLVNAVIIALLAQSGTEAVAAFGIVSRLEAFAFIIIMGVAVGMAPIIGQNWGARRYDRVNETLKLAIRFCVGWSLFVAVLLILFGEPVAHMFSSDPNVTHITLLFFYIVPITYGFANLVNGWASAFNAMGMPQRSLMMIVGKMLVLMVPAVYIGHVLHGPLGVFFAIAVVNVIAGGAVHLWCLRACKRWTQKI